MENGESELILEIKNGGIFGRHSGSVFVSLVDETKILYCIYNDKDMADIYAFDLEEGNSEFLFEDIKNISFRMVGETSDKFIGQIYDGKDRIPVYMIAKEDYYSGNLDAAVKLSL